MEHGASKQWVRACAASEVKKGEPKGVKLAGIPIALYRLDDGIHATHDVCTHAYALLSDGYIEGRQSSVPCMGPCSTSAAGSVWRWPMLTWPLMQCASRTMHSWWKSPRVWPSHDAPWVDIGVAVCCGRLA